MFLKIFKNYFWKMIIITGIIFISEWSLLWGFQDIKMEAQAQSEAKALSKLDARLIEEFSRQISEHKVMLFANYGLIWQKSGQDISYSHYKKIFKEPGRIQVSKQNDTYIAKCEIDAQIIKDEVANISKLHYEKAMQYFREFERFAFYSSQFVYYQKLIIQATDEMINCIELEKEEQANALNVFLRFAHFLRQFTFITPQSYVVAEGASSVSNPVGFKLYFNNSDEKIPLCNIPLTVGYPDKAVLYQTDQNGFCEIKKVENKVIRYHIHTEQIFPLDYIQNPLFIRQFIKQYLHETKGSFLIESIKKNGLVIRSEEFKHDELSFLSGYYYQRGYVFSSEENRETHILQVKLIIEEDRPLHIGGYYMKGYIKVQIIKEDGEIIDSFKTSANEYISTKDRTVAKKNLRNILLKELKKSYKQ